MLVAIVILSVCCQHGMCICSGAASGREALRSLVLRRLVVVVVVLMAIVIFSVCCQTAWAFAAVKFRDDTLFAALLWLLFCLRLFCFCQCAANTAWAFAAGKSAG